MAAFVTMTEAAISIVIEAYALTFWIRAINQVTISI